MFIFRGNSRISVFCNIRPKNWSRVCMVILSLFVALQHPVRELMTNEVRCVLLLVRGITTLHYFCFDTVWGLLRDNYCGQDSDSDFIKTNSKIHDFFRSLQFVGIRTAVVAGSIPKVFFSRWIPQPRVPQMVEDFLLPFHLSTRSSGRFVDKWTMKMIWLIPQTVW